MYGGRCHGYVHHWRGVRLHSGGRPRGGDHHHDDLRDARAILDGNPFGDHVHVRALHDGFRTQVRP